MKVITYNLSKQEKETLVKANAKKHDLTFIANDLNAHTLMYAFDKEVLVIPLMNTIPSEYLSKLSVYGIKQIISWDKPDSLLLRQARHHNIVLHYIHPSLTIEKSAQYIIKKLVSPSGEVHL